MSDLKIGDKIKMKGGGPVMVVFAIDTNNIIVSIHAKYFNKCHDLVGSYFHRDMVRRCYGWF